VNGLTRRDLLRAGAAGAAGLWLPLDLIEQAAAAPARARVDPRALADLRRRLHGTLLLPADHGYAAASQPANTRYENVRPVAVADCADEHDVAVCIRWSGENGVQPVARGGGHSYAGYSTTTGLVINVGRLHTVAVDKRTGVGTVGGGALNQNMFDATVDTGFILPGGTCLGVGVGGLVLGGGIGYNTHWAGLTSDHLRASRIVTAAGEVLHVDPSHHEDLYWACRGGAGGNFGINTSFTFDLVPIPRPDVAFYRFDYRGADAAAAVLAAFDKMLQTAPAALNAVAMSQAAPIMAGGPREAINTFSRGQYIGPLSELRELVSPLLAAATPVTMTLETLPFWKMQRMFASVEAEHHAFGDISRYSRAPLPDSVVAQVIDLVAACPTRDATNNGSMWSLGWVGGPVVDSIGRRETAYVHRNMLTMLRATPVWDTNAPAAVRDGLIGWTRQMIATIAPYTANESYQNFPNRGIADWPTEYYAENFARLVDVKTRYDPNNVFRNQQSIPPRRRPSRRDHAFAGQRALSS
jgi:FAD/FMN-containing dehydrogenase